MHRELLNARRGVYFLLFVLGSGLWHSGCNGGGATPPPPPSLTSIAVTPTNTSAISTTTVQFKAVGTFSDHSTQDLTATVQWSSSASNVASISSGGLATAAVSGSTTIQASSTGVNGSTGLTVTPGFLATGSLPAGGDTGAETLLTDGKVLITGGQFFSGGASKPQLYDPQANTFSATGTFNSDTAEMTPTLLQSGLVLLSGGFNQLAGELYNPQTATFVSTGSLTVEQRFPTVTLLLDGRVLVAGGNTPTFASSNTPTTAAEIYNPATGMYSATGSMNADRFLQTATLLPDGRVLMVGGFGLAGSRDAHASAELYDPATGKFTLTGNLNAARGGHSATLLSNGKVLIAGGLSAAASNGTVLDSAELYDPSTGLFTPTGNLVTARAEHTATLLNNGSVLLAGGFNSTANSIAINNAELYSPGTGSFAATGNLITARVSGAALLNNGTVLLAGGVKDGQGLPASVLLMAEIYQPALPALKSIAVTPASPSIKAGSTQRFVATGTFADGTTSPLASMIWSSSNTAIATVSNDATNRGTAIGVAAGTATITATVGSITSSVTLTVN